MWRTIPGFADAIQGPWLMEQMEAQAAMSAPLIVHDMITEVDFSPRPFRCAGDSRRHLPGRRADHRHRRAGALAGPASRKQRCRARGVSACATCDGFFYRGKRVAVIGGGNTAVEEALFLTHHADKVTLVHRRDSLRAEKILQDRLFANPKIGVVWNNVVEEIWAAARPTWSPACGCATRETGAESDLAVDGVFVAIGHTPTTAVFRGHVAMDRRATSVTAPGSTRTTVPGVFAAGDVQDKIYRQAVTAAGTGCMAALEAEKFLAEPNTTPALAAYCELAAGSTAVIAGVREHDQRPGQPRGRGRDDGLGQAARFPRGGRGRQLHACRRHAESEPVRRRRARFRRWRKRLQVPLFHRHARGLILTEQGESLNRTVREVFAKLAMTEALLTESKEKPAGRLKVTTTHRLRLHLAGAAAARLPGSLSRRSRSACCWTTRSWIWRCARRTWRSACTRRSSPT